MTSGDDLTGHRIFYLSVSLVKLPCFAVLRLRINKKCSIQDTGRVDRSCAQLHVIYLNQTKCHKSAFFCVNSCLVCNHIKLLSSICFFVFCTRVEGNRSLDGSYWPTLSMPYHLYVPPPKKIYSRSQDDVGFSRMQMA